MLLAKGTRSKKLRGQDQKRDSIEKLMGQD